MSVITELKDNVTCRFEKMPSVTAAYVMGSVAEGTMRADSDLDIAVLNGSGQQIPQWEQAQIAADLENRFGEISE